MSRFSPFVIKALVDCITGGSGMGNDREPPIGKYRTGPEIQQFFLDSGIDFSLAGRSRVPATTETLRVAVERDDGDTVVTRMLESVSDPRGFLNEPEKGVAVVEHLNAALEADGWAIVVVNGKSKLMARQQGGQIVSAFAEKTRHLDFDTVERDMERALASAEADPEDATTAACSLLESVCRSILIELSLPLPAKKDIDGLVKAVQEPLNLSPGRMDLPKEVENDVRQVLSGLTTVSKGIGALRTHAGDAHGREKGYRRIDGRIARLAIHASASVAMFFIETWEKQQKRALPLREDNS